MLCPKKSPFNLHYFAKSFLPHNKVLPHNASGIPAPQRTPPFLRENALFSLDSHPFQKSQMRLQNGHEIDPLARKQRFPCRDRVQQEPERYLPEALRCREVLGHHDQVIAEIEKDLSLIPLGQRSPANVIDD